ncbi:hypothetical protein ACRBEV_25020 [Methylobacterium phyllosphaerae]
MREVRRLGLLAIEERRVTSFRNDTNVIRIVSAEWTAWLRLVRRSLIPESGIERTSEPQGEGANP